MYDALKGAFDRVLYSYEMQIFDFLASQKKDFFKELAWSTKKLSTSNRELLKLDNKRSFTDREQKRIKKVFETHDKNLYRFLAEVNMAHQHLRFFCSILFLSENNLRHLEDMASVKDGLYENNFTALIKALDTLDGTDRETLILFNKLRNLLCHTSIEQAKIYLKEEVLVDIMNISSYIQNFLGLVTAHHKKSFEELVEANVQRYASEEMKRVLSSHGLI